MFFRVFNEASRTSTRNHLHEPTTSKPVVPGVCFKKYSPGAWALIGS
jgi:hypothetical protein